MKLILSPETEAQVDTIMAPLRNPESWTALELDFAPNPFAIVLLAGEPGTGKTALAAKMAAMLRRKPLHISFGELASPDLGGTEKAIMNLFKLATESETSVLVAEEVDALLWSRNRVSDDTMHMLGIVNTMLTEIDKFIARPVPSLILMTTNHPELLDAAIMSRITDTISLPLPVGEHAYEIWRSKLPSGLVKDTTKFGLRSFVKARTGVSGITPREIQNRILAGCRKAILENRKPTLEDFE